MKNIKMTQLIISLLIVVFFVFLKIDTVLASECSTATLKKLKQEANKIEFKYNLVDEYNSDEIYTYTMNFVNFSDKFYIMDSNGKKYIYSKTYTADTIFGEYEAGTYVTFKIYGAYGFECQDKLVRTIKISLPYYNHYSRYEECKGIEEFKLCKRNYNGKIESEEWFLQKVKEYKESLNEKEKPVEKEKNFLEKVTEFINDNIVFVIIIVVVIVIGAIVLFIRYLKNRKNIKIDIKELE